MSKRNSAPDGPGVMIFFWLVLEVLAMTFFTVLMPGLFWVWLVSSLLLSALGWLLIGLVLLSMNQISSEEETSFQIYNLTFSDRHSAIVRELVADDVGKKYNETRYRFKPGWNIERLMREHEDLERQAAVIFRERLRRDD